MTLIQTKKITNFPVILYGSDYWGGFVQWMRDKVLVANNITPADVDSIHIVDSPERVRDIVVAFHDQAMMTSNDETEPLPIATVANRD